MHHLVTLPVEVGEWSAGEVLEEQALKDWKLAGSRKSRKEVIKAGSRVWCPWDRQGEEAVLADPPTQHLLCDSHPHHYDLSQT